VSDPIELEVITIADKFVIIINIKIKDVDYFLKKDKRCRLFLMVFLNLAEPVSGLLFGQLTVSRPHLSPAQSIDPAPAFSTRSIYPISENVLL
jgi:hypothetical protein